MPSGRLRRIPGFRRKRRYRRNYAASTIQSAWKRRQRRKKGSLLSRTALANRKAIKQIHKNIDTKYVMNYRASDLNNFHGQIFETTSITSRGGSAVQGVAQDFKYQILSPCVIPHELNLAQTSAVPSHAVVAGTNTRNDSWVQMKSLTIKYKIRAGQANNNDNDLQGVCQPQKGYMWVVLDKAPPNTTDLVASGTAGGWAPNFQSAILFPKLSTCPYPQQPSEGYGSENWDMPVRTQTPFADKTNPSHFSWTNPRTGFGPRCRFKLLKRKVFHLSQKDRNVDNNHPPPLGKQYPTEIEGQLTLKGNYKFHYGNIETMLPDNQRIYVFLTSNVPHIPAIGSLSVQDPPGAQLWMKLRYKDT